MRWKEIPNYNGIYFVSDTGIVKSVNHYCTGKNGIKRIQIGRILKQDVSKKGYLQVYLNLSSKKLHTGVHRLVAICFIKNKDNKPQVNHKDGNKANNHFSNLEWCTNSENQKHAVKNNLVKHNYGEKHHMAKIKNSQVEYLIMKIDCGETMSKLSKELGMSVTAISNIYHRKTYKNI